MTNQSARVDVLTAEVRTLAVGRRQITMSVYRQLDKVAPPDIDPFGRVRDKLTADGYVEVVGKSRTDGSLVRSWVYQSPRSPRITVYGEGHRFHVGCNVERKAATIRVAERDGFFVDFRLDGARAAPSIYSGNRDIDRRPDERDCGRLRVYSAQRYDRIYPDDIFVDEVSADWVKRTADELISDSIKQRELAAPWESLPLIVLAGLR